MDDKLKSLEELFERSIFRIPDYQRGYSWETLQLEEFWGDLSNLSLDKEHYTGMISLQKLDRAYMQGEDWNNEQWLLDEWGYSAYAVVDGQQRLTTIVILIQELVNFYKKMNPKKKENEIFVCSKPLSKIREDYLIIAKPDSKRIKTDRFSYEAKNSSFKYFKHEILGEPNGGILTESFYTLRLAEAKKFFHDRLEEEFASRGFDGIEEVFKKVTQNLKFIRFDIDRNFNVFVAFETMNNRGKNLSNLEILKNRLIYLTTILDGSPDEQLEVRKDVNEAWKDVYEYLGKNADKPLSDEDFLQDHWIIYFGYTRSNKVTYSSFLLDDYFNLNKVTRNRDEDSYETNVIDEVETDLDVSELEIDSTIVVSNKKEKLSLESIGKYVDSLKSLVPFWYLLQNPDASVLGEDVKEALVRLNRLQFAYFKPLITVLLSKQDLSSEDKVRALEKIERFIFLHFRLNNYKSTYKNSFFWNMAHRFYTGEDGVDFDFIMRELDQIEYLSDNKVATMSGLLGNVDRLFKNYDGYYSCTSWIRYFLYEYELHLMNGQANQILFPETLFMKNKDDKISVEHIYPQTDTDEYWVERFGKYSPEDREHYKGSLGNLLPLSLSINISMQNSSFEAKKYGTDRVRGYLKGSHSEQEVAGYDEWTAESILERGLKMLSFMEERFDFVIPNKADRVRMLGLGFIEDIEKLEKVDVTEPLYVEKNDAPSAKREFNESDLVRQSAGKPVFLMELYRIIDEFCMSIGEGISKNSTINYIGYFTRKKFCEVHFMSSCIRLYLRNGEYEDPQEKIVNDHFNWSNTMRLDVFEDDDFEYVKDMIEQSYKKTL